MKIGDLVVRKSYDKDITFKIIDIKEKGNKYDYKVYNSSSKEKVWEQDEYLNY